MSLTDHSNRIVLAGTTSTPGGDLAVLARPDGTVRAAGYATVEELVVRLEVADRGAGGVEVREVEPAGLPPALLDALRRYAEGDVGALDRVPVQQPGGAFYQDVWHAMRLIPPAATATYTELAAMAGRPAAVRAAGTACARNLAAPFVPCHRVVRSDGALGGYAYGLEVKRTLLTHERTAAERGTAQVASVAEVLRTS